ncbi:tetratricopeptide repeat protein, partial [bacterium]|nr:tetratricopeptide repeat protein [bacterium]
MLKRFLLIITTLIICSSFNSSGFVLAQMTNQAQKAYLASFEMAENAVKAKNLLDAINYYQAALAAQPRQIRARFRLGQILMSMGRHQDAIWHFQTILQDYPQNISTRVSLGECFHALGKAKEAFEQIDWILKVQPDHDGARKMMSILKSDSGFENKVSPDNFIPIQRNASPRKITPPNVTVPPSAALVKGWQVKDFLSAGKDSYGVSVEYAKLCIEKDDLEKGLKALDKAEGIAVETRNTKRFLEVQVFKTLITLYKADIRNFGTQLIKVKPFLSNETYISFLDVYNKAQAATSSIDISRLIGGVALGAEHYSVAARILSEVVQKVPSDQFAVRLLAQAYLENRNFTAAESAFHRLVKLIPNESEPYFNLARFYLTVNFNLPEARR